MIFGASSRVTAYTLSAALSDLDDADLSKMHFLLICDAPDAVVVETVAQNMKIAFSHDEPMEP